MRTPIEDVEKKFIDRNPDHYPAVATVVKAWKVFTPPPVERISLRVFAGNTKCSSNITVDVPKDCVVSFIEELLKDETVKELVVFVSPK